MDGPAPQTQSKFRELLKAAHARKVTGMIRVDTPDGMLAALVLRQGLLVGAGLNEGAGWQAAADSLVEHGLVARESLEVLDPRRAAIEPEALLVELADAHGLSADYVSSEIESFIEHTIAAIDGWQRKRSKFFKMPPLHTLSPGEPDTLLLRLLLHEGITAKDLPSSRSRSKPPDGLGARPEASGVVPEAPAARPDARATRPDTPEQPVERERASLVPEVTAAESPAPPAEKATVPDRRSWSEAAGLAEADEVTKTVTSATITQLDESPQELAPRPEPEPEPEPELGRAPKSDPDALSANLLVTLLSVTMRAPPIPLGHHEIAIIDDNQAVTEIIQHAFQEAKLEVRTFTRTENALRLLEQASSQGVQPLVVADLFMPRVDGTGVLGGLEVLERAKALTLPPYVVLMGDHMTADAKDRAEQMGADEFVKKPLRWSEAADRDPFLEELVTKVRAVLSGEPIIAPRSEPFEPVPEAPMRSTAEERLWREAMRELADGLSSPEVLLLVLRFASHALGRAVLFRVEGDELVGIGQFGIHLGDADPDEAVRAIRLAKSGHPLFEAAARRRSPMRAEPGSTNWEETVRKALGGNQPNEVFAGPVFCGSELIAMVYGDNIPDPGPLGDTTNLEVFLFQASMALERQQLEERVRALEGKTS